MSRLSILILFASSLSAQVSTASLGYVRDLRGDLRPVLGVAGAFVLGDAVASGAVTMHFDSSAGCAATSSGVLALSDTTIEPSAADCKPPRLPVHFDSDEIVIEGSGVRLRTPEPIVTIEQMGRNWFVLRGKERLYALRTVAAREAIYALPEAAQ